MKYITTLGFSLFFTGIALLLFAAPCPAQTLSALEIMQKADARDDGDNMTCTRTMVLIDKNNHKRKRAMNAFSKDKGEDTLKLIFLPHRLMCATQGFSPGITAKGIVMMTSGSTCRHLKR